MVPEVKYCDASTLHYSVFKKMQRIGQLWPQFHLCSTAYLPLSLYLQNVDSLLIIAVHLRLWLSDIGVQRRLDQVTKKEATMMNRHEMIYQLLNYIHARILVKSLVEVGGILYGHNVLDSSINMRTFILCLNIDLSKL